MSTNSQKLILALETAVGPGSVAILDRGEIVVEIDGRVAAASRAEELLGVIRISMERAGAALQEISSIAVSIGPGSYSGIRIGVSTAMGLKDALGTECRGVSVLEAMAFSSRALSGVVTAVPLGKNDVAWQLFHKLNAVPKPLSPPSLLSVAEFIRALGEFDRLTVHAPRALLERIGQNTLGHDLVAADNASTLAGAVGRYAFAHRIGETLLPIYLRSGTGF